MNRLPASRTLVIASSSIISIGFFHYLWGVFTQHKEEEKIQEKNEENKENNEEPKLEGINSDLTLKNIIGCSNIQDEVKRYVEYLKTSAWWVCR